MKKYRSLYKKYYGIEFGKDFDVHHIDFNRENNNIDNLILLPKELHSKYHFCVNAVKQGIDYKINWQYSGAFMVDTLRNFCDVMEEIDEWKLYKNQLEMNKQNEVK